MDENRILKTIQVAFNFTVSVLVFTLVLGMLGIYLYNNPGMLETDQVPKTEPIKDVSSTSAFVDSVHVTTGFIQGKHVELVIASCTGCHSSKLIIQNRATKDGWKGMIKWMQETQNLQDLGENEEKIVHYLATYYAPEEQGRRKPLQEIDWYDLE